MMFQSYFGKSRFKTGEKIVLKNPDNSYHLLAGLTPGTEAIFISYNYGAALIDVGGKERRISDCRFKHEMEYEVGNQWLYESRPEIVRRKQLEREAKRKLEDAQ